MSYVCYLLNHISCESLNSQIPLSKLYGVTPDISIMMMLTFYQSVKYASHNESFPSTSEEKHAYCVRKSTSSQLFALLVLLDL